MLKKVIFFSVSASLALANSIEFDEIVVTATGFEGKLSDEVRNVYVAGENLAVVSARKGLDPRNAFGLGSFTMAQGSSSYGAMRTITGGITLTF